MIKRAMIMAAGIGSRLDPLTRSIPKPLVPVANQPVMDLLFKHLKKYGINEVIANTHAHADLIHDRYLYSNKTGISFSYIYENELSGTAGGVKKCETFFENEDDFLVLSGDGLTNIELDKVFESHKKSGSIVTMVLTHVPKSEVCKFGVVVTDKNNQVIEFQEKPALEEAKSTLINTGIYVFKKEVFNYIPEGEFYDFARNVFPSLIEHKMPINTYSTKCYWSDIGSIEQYKQANFDVLSDKIHVDLPYEKTSFGWADKSAHLNPYSIKDAKLVIGKNSTIQSNVELEGNIIIGDNTTIKSGSSLKNCIILDNVTVENNINLENCIISNGVLIKEDSIVKKNSTIPENAIVAKVEQDTNLNECFIAEQI